MTHPGSADPHPPLDLLAPVHTSTRRDYLERVTRHDKAACAVEAKKYGHAYWDGDRRFGYGGYRYDGRWLPVARNLAEHYGLRSGDRVLDVGCGKAHLLYELTRVVPGLKAAGMDISTYALRHTRPELSGAMTAGDAKALPFQDHSFDLVFSLNTLHNLEIQDLSAALGEIERVGRGKAYVVVESYRNEREKVNLLYWQLTCAAFHSPKEWAWLFDRFGYTGDHGFIFFE